MADLGYLDFNTNYSFNSYKWDYSPNIVNFEQDKTSALFPFSFNQSNRYNYFPYHPPGDINNGNPFLNFTSSFSRGFSNITSGFDEWFSNFCGGVSRTSRRFGSWFGDIGQKIVKGFSAIKDIALRECNLGIKESDGSHHKYGLKGRQPWCVAFAKWVYEKALGKCPWGNDYSCLGVKNWALKNGLYEKPNVNNIKIGDAVIWQPKTSGKSHIGIVISFDPRTGRIETAEGNTSDRTKTRTYFLKTAKIDGIVKISKYRA